MTIDTLECPECGGPMVSRRAVATGRLFFGCQSYPACDGTLDMDGEVPLRRVTGSSELPSDRQRRADRSRWRA